MSTKLNDEDQRIVDSAKALVAACKEKYPELLAGIGDLEQKTREYVENKNTKGGK